MDLFHNIKNKDVITILPLLIDGEYKTHLSYHVYFSQKSRLYIYDNKYLPSLFFNMRNRSNGYTNNNGIFMKRNILNTYVNGENRLIVFNDMLRDKIIKGKMDDKNDLIIKEKLIKPKRTSFPLKSFSESFMIESKIEIDKLFINKNQREDEVKRFLDDKSFKNNIDSIKDDFDNIHEIMSVIRDETIENILNG